MPDDAAAHAAMGPPRPTATFHALTAVWVVPAAIMSASIAGDLMLSLVVVLLGGTLGIAWCVALARVLLRREARNRLAWNAMAHWAVCPLTGLLFAVLSFTQWPYELRVRISEPALLRLVEDLDRGRADPGDPGRAGLIFVDYAKAEEDGVVFTTESVFPTEYGLVYSRDGRTPNPRHLPLWHLYGRWYTFIRWN
jgi:hypothetical protein